jgi:hypothetical protein
MGIVLVKDWEQYLVKIVTVENLRDLFGYWSCFALKLGFAGALVSHCSGKLVAAPAAANKTKVLRLLPWLMWLVGFFIGCVVLPLSMAHAGRLPFDSPVEWGYDRSFALLIAFAFGLVFVIDAFRFPILRQKHDRWVCLFLYLAIALFLISAGTTHRYE